MQADGTVLDQPLTLIDRLHRAKTRGRPASSSWVFCTGAFALRSLKQQHEIRRFYAVHLQRVWRAKDQMFRYFGPQLFCRWDHARNLTKPVDCFWMLRIVSAGFESPPIAGGTMGATR